jgi:hypothetical protein
MTNSESYAPALSIPSVLSQHSATSHTAGLDSGYSSHIASSRINSTMGSLPGASNSQFEGYSINDKLNRGQLQVLDMGNSAPKSRFQDSMESTVVHTSQNQLPYSNRSGYPVTQVQHNSDEYSTSDLLARASGASSIVTAPRGDYYPSTAVVAGTTAVAPGAASATPFIPGDVRYRRQNNVVTQPPTALSGDIQIPNYSISFLYCISI